MEIINIKDIIIKIINIKDIIMKVINFKGFTMEIISIKDITIEGIIDILLDIIDSLKTCSKIKEILKATAIL